MSTWILPMIARLSALPFAEFSSADSSLSGTYCTEQRSEEKLPPRYCSHEGRRLGVTLKLSVTAEMSVVYEHIGFFAVVPKNLVQCSLL